MSKLIINDLELDKELDRQAMKAVLGGKGALGKLVSAFKAGWKIGKWLDEKYEISDRIAGTGKHWR